jgi:sigma-E factor negative regulatory protein RseA
MKKIESEQISVLVDGETPANSRDQLVTALLESGQEARATFSRYRLIGDMMRDESVRPVDVASLVSAALDEEPTILAPSRREPPAWLRPVAGVAVAASVAAAAIVVAPQVFTEEPAGTPAVTPGFVAGPVTELAPQLVAGGSADPVASPASEPGAAFGDARWRTLDPDLAERLNRLLIEHHEYAGRSGVTGPVPHIGVVSYDVE